MPNTTSFQTEQDQEVVNFTLNAANKVYSLIKEEQNAQLKLRVFITGGGCSGFQYGFTFDETVQEDDTVISKCIAATTEDPSSTDATVTLLIDAMSMTYLHGAEIDYREDAQGAQFIIRNPNAKTTCGCGSSFAPKDDTDDTDDGSSV